jgi:seryl-tRNA synthetase
MTSQIEEAQSKLQDQLIAAGLLIATGEPGLYGRGEVFEDVIERFADLVRRTGSGDRPARWRFPPIISVRDLVKSNYLRSMPQLIGAIHSFGGGVPQHVELLSALEKGEDWGRFLGMTNVVLTPAACYPCYPRAAAAGPLPPGGRLIDIVNYCFRHEPSVDPARMQAFRMYEFVRMGAPADVRAWIQGWQERGSALLRELGLAGEVVPANDPFFGRSGRMLAANQREQQLKFEFAVPIATPLAPTAVASFNYHQDHFGGIFTLRTHDGEPAHTACVGFGLERVALALFKTHGFDPAAWPASVRRQLEL